MFKSFNSHHRLMSPYRPLRLSVRHNDGRQYSKTDQVLFAVWDTIGGLLLGATFFFVGFSIFQ